MSIVPQSYDDWKLATPEDGDEVMAHCPICGTDFVRTDPEFQECPDCKVVVCQECDRTLCDGCERVFCSECIEEVSDTGGDGLVGDNPLWFCAECKREHVAELELVEVVERMKGLPAAAKQLAAVNYAVGRVLR